MNSSTMTMTKKDYTCAFISVILSVLFLLRNIAPDRIISIWGDEFGYWSGGAYFAGLDWSSVCSSNAYYGWGYGLLLFPILKIFGNNTILMVKMAVIMQGLLMGSCCIACYYICKSYFCIKSASINTIVSLVSVCYISNLVYVNFILSEILLTVIVWWSFFLVIKYLETRNVLYLITFNTLCVYSFSVHSRGIGLMASCFIIDMYVLLKTNTNKSLFIFFVSTLIVGYYLIRFIRTDYINALYDAASASSVGANLETGQMWRFKALINPDYILSIFQNILGNLYYIISASFGLIVCFFVSVYKCVKERRKQVSLEIMAFTVFFTALMICVAYWAGGNTVNASRTDALFYGRYYEYTLGPCLMVGLCELYKGNYNYRHVFFFLTIYAVIALCVSKSIPPFGSLTTIWASSSALARLIYHYNRDIGLSNEIVIQIISRLFVLAILIILFFYNIAKKRKAFMIIVSIVYLTYSLTNANVLLERNVFSWTTELAETQMDLYEHVADNSKVYIWSATLGGGFQLIDVSNSLTVLDEAEKIKSIEIGAYVITNNSGDCVEAMPYSFDLEYSNTRYCLWKNNSKGKYSE